MITFFWRSVHFHLASSIRDMKKKYKHFFLCIYVTVYLYASDDTLVLFRQWFIDSFVTLFMLYLKIVMTSSQSLESYLLFPLSWNYWMWLHFAILPIAEIPTLYRKASFRGAPSAQVKFQRTIEIFIKLPKDRRWCWWICKGILLFHFNRQ